MRRGLAALILCLMLPACALAFDLIPYEIESIEGTVADLQAGDLQDRFSLEGHPYRLFSTGGLYIGFHENEGEPAQFMLYDHDLHCFARGQLPSERAELCSLYDDGDAVIVSLLLPMKPKSQFLAARIGKDGQLRWQNVADYDALNSTVALPDGAGGAWLGTQAADGDEYDPYAGTRLTHINVHGEAEWMKTLKTGREILLVQSAVSHPESGCVTLYCSLVAKSKGIYTALAVTLDPDGQVLDTQARDFSMRGDTDFAYRIDENGVPWVFSRSGMHYGGKGVLVPFDALPVVQTPQVGIY